jgi:hypothetical protein
MVPGHRLYNQFQEKKKKKEEHYQQITKNRLNEEMRNVTFTPTINPYSNKLTKKDKKYKKLQVADRLLQKGILKQEKIFKKRINENKSFDNSTQNKSNMSNLSYIMASKKRGERENEYNLIQKFKEKSFISKTRSVTPNRNNISNISSEKTFENFKIDTTEDRGRSKDKHSFSPINETYNIHNYLYEESKINKVKNMKKEKEYKEKYYPFKPSIPESVRNLVKREETKDAFIDRLVNSKKIKEKEIIVEERKKSFKHFNENNRKKIEKDINENRSNISENKILEKSKEIQMEKEREKNEKKEYWIQHAKESIIKLKLSRYKEIFDQLDSDKDGLISTNKIKLSILNTDVLEKLTPVLKELQSQNKPMNFKDFCIQADSILNLNMF